MASQIAQQGLSETLRRHVEENEKLAAELRERFGDPSASMGAFLREKFGPNAFVREHPELGLDRSSWLEDDLWDDDIREDDGR